MKTTRRIGLGLLVLLAVLATAEVVLRLLGPGPVLAVFASDPDGRNFRLIPGARGRVIARGGQVIDVSIDPSGHRATVGSPSPGVGVRELDVIGDSQVFGWGLSDRETIPSRLQARLGPHWRVVNWGIPAIGPIEYAAALQRVPKDAVVLVVLTEANDLWDTYGIGLHYSACGYQTTTPVAENPISCMILNSRVIQYAALLLGQLRPPQTLTPLGFDRASKAAASVLAYRARTLLAAPDGTRRPGVRFALVPWNVRFAPEDASDFAPPPDMPPTASYFDDDYGMLAVFRRAPHPATLFQSHDFHLMPAGAELFADTIADAMLAEQRAAAQPAAPAERPRSRHGVRTVGGDEWTG